MARRRAGTAEPGTRMFVAVSPPDDVGADLDDFLAPRREAADFGWAGPDQFHVTLAFLAAVPDRRLDELAERLAEAAARRTPFRARIRGGGAFPDVARSRVLYAGLAASEAGSIELDRMASGARAAASRSGIEVDGRRFRPHVTVARLGRPAETSRWVRLLDGYAGPEWTVDHLALIASYLGEGARGRPRYQTVLELALGPGPARG